MQLSPLTRRLIAALLAVVVGACGSPGSLVRYTPGVEIKGVQSVLQSDKSADVVLVHGMCYHDSTWVDQTNESLASRLGLSINRALGLATPIGQFGGVLYANELSGTQGERVRTFAILWSPVTAGARAKLCYDTTAETASCPATVTHLQDRRAMINASVKNEIMDGCLSDALYAVGQEGIDRLGSTIEEGLSIALAGGSALSDSSGKTLELLQKERAPLFVVTESLGSKLFIDAVIRLANRSCEARKSMSVSMKRTVQVFMEANQLPILALTYDPVLSQNCGAASERSSSPSGGKGLGALGELRGASTATSEAITPPPLRIAAFSDPNDLLSYTLVPAAALPEGIVVADIVVENDWRWLGVFENPYAAHTTYKDKCLVNNVIAYGTLGLSMFCPPSLP